MPWFIDRTVSQSSFTSLRRLSLALLTWLLYFYLIFIFVSINHTHLTSPALRPTNSKQCPGISFHQFQIVWLLAFAGTLILLIISQIICYSLVHNRHCYAVTVKKPCTGFVREGVTWGWIWGYEGHARGLVREGVTWGGFGVTPRKVFSVMGCPYVHFNPIRWKATEMVRPIEWQTLSLLLRL